MLTGTTIAQTIPIIVTPILTRMYSPSDFGVFALYIAIVSIVSVLATGRYEMAIMLPIKDDDAESIVALSITLSFILSLVIFFVIFIFGEPIFFIFGNEEIGKWMYFIPISIFLFGVYQSLFFWNSRKQKFKNIAINKIIQNTVISSTQFFYGGGGGS